MEVFPAKKHILILGGGFGGISAAVLFDRCLRRMPELARALEVTLINNHHSHLYTPALYEIAAIPQGEHALKYVKSSIAIPLADIFHDRAVEWLERSIIRIDLERHLVEFENTDSISFDYLIVALGAETSYFNIPGLKEHSFPLKTFGDAVRLRDRVERSIESGEERQIVIGGAGATGVEVAAEFENFICMMQDRMARPRCQVSITLVEGSPEILPGFASSVVAAARQRLQGMGVRMVTNALVTGVSETAITLKDGRTLPYSIFVWTGGVQAASVLQTTGLSLSKKGGLIVDRFLEVKPGIYAVGDNAAFTDSAGKPRPWNVPVAEAEAKVAVANIIARIKGRALTPFNPEKHYPFILALGRTHAIADLGYIRLAGSLAWMLKLAVELKYLVFILPWWQALAVWWRYVKVSRSNDVRKITRADQVTQ